MCNVKTVITLLVLPLITGCAAIQNKNDIGPYPSNYKELIKNKILRSFYDPYSLRNVSIAPPVQANNFPLQGWAVCLEVNAKNKNGNYSGLRRGAFLIQNNNVSNITGNPALCNNPELNYSPWPEIDAAPSVLSYIDVPTLPQKEKWVTNLAIMNGCINPVSIKIKQKEGAREVFQASCGNKTIDFTCEFDTPITETMGGIPFTTVTNKSYQTHPACWR